MTLPTSCKWRTTLGSFFALVLPLLICSIASNHHTNSSSNITNKESHFSDRRSSGASNSRKHLHLHEERKVGAIHRSLGLASNNDGLDPLDPTRELEEGESFDRKNGEKKNSKKPFENPKPTTPDMKVPAPAPGGDGSNPNQGVPYTPGLINKNKQENGLFLSAGLKSRIIAETGRKVKYYNGDESDSKFHTWPDGGDVFADTRAENLGGWIYLSNSEEDVEGQGGVGALTFDAQGNIIDYRMVLTGTTMNCNGGRTHFGAWVSCEEDFWARAGKAWLVDPTGERQPQPIAMSLDGGIFEAFAYDIRYRNQSQFFLTEDDYYGAMKRWQPTNPDWDNPWDLLLGEGATDYLVLLPNQNNHTHGLFTWVKRKQQAQRNAGMYYPNSEGIAVHENLLYFVCKRFSHMFVLDLDKNTYTRHSTLSETFDGTPDGVRTYITTTEDAEEEAMLYFTEDGGNFAGIHGQNANGEIIPILEGDYIPETTGLSFTPDGRRMYFAFQEDGLVFEVQRIDGKPFHAKTLNVKHHQYEADVAVDSDRRHRRRERRGR